MIKKTLAIIISSAAFSACMDDIDPIIDTTPEPVDTASRFTPEAYTAVEADDINGLWVLTIEDYSLTINSLDETGNEEYQQTYTGAYRATCTINIIDLNDGEMIDDNENIGEILCPQTVLNTIQGAFIVEENNFVSSDLSLNLTITDNNSAIGTWDQYIENENEFGTTLVAQTGSVYMVKVANAENPSPINFGSTTITAVNDTSTEVTKTPDIQGFSEFEGETNIDTVDENESSIFQTLFVSNSTETDGFEIEYYGNVGESVLTVQTFDDSNIAMFDTDEIALTRTLSDDETVTVNAEGINQIGSPYNISIELEL